jgi:hypothetical protein
MRSRWRWPIAVACATGMPWSMNACASNAGTPSKVSSGRPSEAVNAKVGSLTVPTGSGVAPQPSSVAATYACVPREDSRSAA